MIRLILFGNLFFVSPCSMFCPKAVLLGETVFCPPFLECFYLLGGFEKGGTFWDGVFFLFCFFLMFENPCLICFL